MERPHPPPCSPLGPLAARQWELVCGSWLLLWTWPQSYTGISPWKTNIYICWTVWNHPPTQKTKNWRFGTTKMHLFWNLGDDFQVQKKSFRGWFSGAKKNRGSSIIKATKGMGKKGIEMSLWHVSNPPLMLVQQETTKLQCALSQGCRLHATRY